MKIQDVLSAVVYKQHGWAVAQQFDDTYSKVQGFEKQNLNALKYIYDTIDDVLYSDIFDEETFDEIKSYLIDLDEYIESKLKK